MKVVLPKNVNDGKKKISSNCIIPLVQPVTKKPPKEMLHSFKLRTDPADGDSDKYELTVARLNSDSSLESTMTFYNSMTTRVLPGLGIVNANQGPLAVTIIQGLLQGTPLATFTESIRQQREAELAARVATHHATNAAGPPPNDIRAATLPYTNIAMGAIITWRAPYKALQRQKRYMRRECRKPVDMTIRDFFTRFQQLNLELLPQFPPFNRNGQVLNNDEVIDIIVSAVPRSWTKEMDRQGFDPITNPLTDVIDFCERIESTEDPFTPVESKKPRGKGKKPESSGDQKNCMLHGMGSHSTEECKVLKAQAKRMKEGKGASDDKPKYSNKTWKRSADSAKSSAKKELAAFVKEAVREELNAMTKKRKSEEESSDEEGEEANNVEDDLANFNYSDMNNLTIADKDEEADDEVEC